MAKILLVEDDKDDRSAMRDALEEQGFEVVEARDGKHALEMLTSGETPSLVILDLEMPVMAGADLVGVMKQYHRLARVPVLIVSGSRTARVPRHDRIVGFLPKPLELSALLETVRTSVDQA